MGYLGGILKNCIFKHAHACNLICSFNLYMHTLSFKFFKIYGPMSQKGVYFGLHAEGPVPGKAVNKVLDGTASFYFLTRVEF